MTHPEQAPGPTETPDDGAPIEDLIAEGLGRYEDGGEQALQSYLTSLGARAGEVAERIEGLRDAGMLEAPLDRLVLPEKLGEFVLGERLGAGGMGIVFAAEQESLRRTVALKLIRPEYSVYEASRARFLREVEAAARLSHPGIVQVLTVGEDRGQLYFTMEHLEGASLSDLMKDLRGCDPGSLEGSVFLQGILAHTGGQVPQTLPELFSGSYTNTCLRIGRDVALALQHAHERGVLHRDVKPSNVIVTEAGRVVLLDFGLAALSGSTHLTNPGSQVGSPLYQTPESLEKGGAVAGPHTDVYGLGVTLHELISIAPPFRADSPSGLMRKIREGRIEPLSAANPRTRGDIETVLGAATDIDPAHRYESSVAFASDLSNALELRPIQARRVSPALRVRRWARRHAEATLVSAVLGVALLAVAILFAIQQRRARTELADALDKSEQTLGHAQDAVEVLMSLAESDKLKRLDFAQERRAAASGAMRFYENLVTIAPRRTDMLHGQSKARQFMAQWYESEDRYEEALVELEQAFELVERAHRADRAEHAYLDGMGSIRAASAAAARDLGRLETALEYAAEAEVLNRDYIDRFGTPSGTRWDLLNAVWVRAEVLEQLLDYPAAEASYLELIELEHILDAHLRPNPNRKVAFANTVMGYSRLLVRAGQYDKALEETAPQIAMFEELLNDNPRVPRGQEEFGRMLRVRGHAFWGIHERESALDCLRRSTAAYASELEFSPGHPRYSRGMSESEAELGTALVAAGQIDAGVETLRRGFERITSIEGPARRGHAARRKTLLAAARYLPHAGHDAPRVRSVLQELCAAFESDPYRGHALLQEEVAAARAVLAGAPISGPGPLRTL